MPKKKGEKIRTIVPKAGRYLHIHVKGGRTVSHGPVHHKKGK